MIIVVDDSKIELISIFANDIIFNGILDIGESSCFLSVR